jgi:eukaryotic translation initiation factor 2C
MTKVVFFYILAEIKRVGDVVLGIMTCNITLGTFRKCSEGQKGTQPCLNILYKLSFKMGGYPMSIERDQSKASDLLNDTTVFVGADVSPSAPGSKLPSIAALTFNISNQPKHFACIVRLQDSRQEIIVDMRVMIKEALRSYYTFSKKKPSKIIIYRDGVSEGQFLKVMQAELAAVHVGCNEVEDNYKPNVTFIINQKQHNTRLIPSNCDPRDRDQNIPPGTVVDNTIVHPNEFDFFLCSHQGIQGTSKPVHYHVLHDDNKLSSDTIQQLTFQMAHLYARCPRSVSLPAPVLYAKLAAQRAREHMKRVVDAADVTSSSSGGTIQYDMAELKEALQVKKALKKRMFYV